MFLGDSTNTTKIIISFIWNESKTYDKRVRKTRFIRRVQKQLSRFLGHKTYKKKLMWIFEVFFSNIVEVQDLVFLSRLLRVEINVCLLSHTAFRLMKLNCVRNDKFFSFLMFSRLHSLCFLIKSLNKYFTASSTLSTINPISTCLLCKKLHENYV